MNKFSLLLILSFLCEHSDSVSFSLTFFHSYLSFYVTVTLFASLKLRPLDYYIFRVYNLTTISFFEKI